MGCITSTCTSSPDLPHLHLPNPSRPPPHRGEEHGEGVDEGLGEVPPSEGQQDGRREQDVTDGEQEGGQEQLEVRSGVGRVRAAPPRVTCRQVSRSDPACLHMTRNALGGRQRGFGQQGKRSES